MESAELGVVGNAAYALLGPNLQAGEAEWVPIKSEAFRGTPEWRIEAIVSVFKAYHQLCARHPDRKFKYELVGDLSRPAS